MHDACVLESWVKQHFLREKEVIRIDHGRLTLLKASDSQAVCWTTGHHVGGFLFVGAPGTGEASTAAFQSWGEPGPELQASLLTCG
jgi:hypothetical protein